MWILECEGDILNDTKVWLKPGKKYMFGRTRPSLGNAIKDRSVSRKHVLVEVGPVKPGDGSSIRARSQLSVTDLNTTAGTDVDGDILRNNTKVLEGDEHAFKLGAYDVAFRIKWQPVVLTFTFPSKETKNGKDPLTKARSQLEEIDVKTVLPYVRGATTHVIAGKRNTAKSLQALLNGICIVDIETYLAAIQHAATPSNLDEPESLSLLEQDFDKHWPDPSQYLPPPGKEADPRPAELFAPNLARQSLLEGYTFIFGDLKQFDSLQPPIANGGGKALLFTIRDGKTTAAELVHFMKEAAGESGLGPFRDGSRGRGVALIRFQGSKNHQDWAVQLQEKVQQITQQACTEQNEFLNVILNVDPTPLRRPLTPHDASGVNTSAREPTNPQLSNGHPTSSEPSQAMPTPKEQPQQPATRRGRPRALVVSAFKGFDDGYDPARTAAERVASRSRSRTRRNPEILTPSVNGTNADAMAVDTDGEDANGTPAPRTRKRCTPDDEDVADANDALLPAAAAMKRRRIEDEAEARRRGKSIEPGATTQKSKSPAPPPAKAAARKKKANIDIKEVVAERRRAEDEAAARDATLLHESIANMSVEEMQRLAVVEKVDVRPRPNGISSTEKGRGARWDERWNGRKNFKRFRRQGEVPARRDQTVIVPLEAAGIAGPPRPSSFGTSFAARSKAKPRRRKEKEFEEDDDDEDDDGAAPSPRQTFISARSNQTRDDEAEDGEGEGGEEHEAAVPPSLTQGGQREVINVDAPRTTRRQEKNGPSPASTAKRSAPSTRVGKAKKQRTMVIRRDEDSESEDEMQFRFEE